MQSKSKGYAQVGGVVGKLATKLASQKYLGVKLDKEKHALEIREALRWHKRTSYEGGSAFCNNT